MTIKAFYFPLVQHITVDNLSMSIEELKHFTSLRWLRLKHVTDPGELSYYELRDTLSSEKVVTALLQGALDEKLEVRAKSDLLTQGHQWQVEAFSEPGRRFEVIDTAHVQWEAEAGENRGSGSMVSLRRH